jgi:pimeloyl-ACP methyl ester carboxylesterase
MSIANVLDSVETLAERFLPPLEPLKARFRLNVANVTRDVVVNGDRCRVEEPRGEADVEISTDAMTWREIELGRLSGIEAFGSKRLSIRGSIEKSLHFEPLFRRPPGGFKYSIERVETRGGKISALFAGDVKAEPLVLIHGLGATKASWLTVVPQLAKRFRVIAIDLPGFGASDKPMGRYDARWFAHRVTMLLDELKIDSAYVAGNSMGGRVAMELGMRHPDRVKAIACLCPAAAFTKRPALRLVRVLRPELGVVASRLPRARILPSMRQLFADPSCVEESWYDAAIDDFLSVWRSPRARMAFFASLRNIYLDPPAGDQGFWTRLKAMKTPALYIYGKHDVLISHHFAKKVRRHLPSADIAVWSDCGHVPQIEFPDRTAEALVGFYDRAAARQVSA